LLFISTLLVKCEKYDVDSKLFPGLHSHEVSDISENGATFNAEITFRGNFKIISYGFVWSDKSNPKIENSDRIVYYDNILTNKFSAQISTSLKEGKTYYVRSFVETENYRVYGNEVTFLSLGSSAPQVLSFSPKTGTWGDTINIYGKNFSFIKEKNSVKLGEISSEIVAFSDTILTVIVPAKKNLPTVKINVAVLGNNESSPEDFHYLVPGIVKAEPVLVTFLDTITITGVNFHPLVEYNSVVIGDISTEIISINTTEIKFIVPGQLKTMENEMKLISTGFEVNPNTIFTLKPPVLLSFSPDTVFKPAEIITLNGENFNPIFQNNSVHVGNFEAEIIESSVNYIKVILPSQILPDDPRHYNYDISLFTDVSLEVTVTGQSVMSDENVAIHWLSTFTRKADFPGSARHNGVAFAINGKGYYGTGMAGLNADSQLLNDFWEYNPLTDQWEQIADFPGEPRAGASAFVIDGEGYTGLGTKRYYWYNSDDSKIYFKDFYKYEPGTNTWIQISEFSGTERHSAASFTLGMDGYIVAGYWGANGADSDTEISQKVWKYESLSDNWVQIGDFPASSWIGSAAGFNIGNDGYIYNDGKLYKFMGNDWNELPAIEEKIWDHIAFSINGKGYFGMGLGNSYKGSYTIWEYDPLANTFPDKSLLIPDSRGGASVFVVNDKAYVIGGIGRDDVLKDVWEFDPSKPEF